jgi:glucosamine-6-phosphate deaminase
MAQNQPKTPHANISLTYDSMSKKAAQEIAKLLREKPDAVLGLATGSTPIGMYEELVRMHREEGLDFSKATFFNLDEYVNLPKDHPESYYSFMQQHLFSKINANPSRIHIPNGNAPDLDKECLDYEAKIKAAGGIDLQVLGIGGNGHIGFSEPGTPFSLRTHKTTLTEQTRKDNARFFDGDINKVPTHALSMGPATIMDAKRVILLANKESKLDAVHKSMTGPVTEEVPASILQRHPNVTFYLDKTATKGFDKAVEKYFESCATSTWNSVVSAAWGVGSR